MKEISAAEVQRLLEEGKPLNIIDVREAEEVAAGKIPDAIHIPLGLLQFKLQELEKDKEYIVVCRSGNRSGMAVRFLEYYGFHAINMVGGMLDWTGAIE